MSISYAAVELARKIFGSLEGKKVLLIGAGEMAEQSGESMESLIARVRSPGGTTAAAFDHLDGTDFRAIFHAAVVAARDRAIDLADQAHEQGKD